MNKTISTTLAVIGILALAGVLFFAGSMYARANFFRPSMMFGWNNNEGYGPDMMTRRGPSMMGGYGFNNANLPVLTIEQTNAAAEKYLVNLGDPDLEIAESMIFDNNGYVIVREAGTGIGAFELLVDPVTQIAHPEHGPNMMWNLKYGGFNHENMMGGGMMMGGHENMMQGLSSTAPLNVNAEMAINPQQAIEFAQKYLDANIAGATIEHPMPFYGYYTLDYEKDGRIAGMLSVNGYSGQVFLHTWHGTFIEEEEYE